ncbi:hypothetical protein MNB_SM-3-908 [hydrothermal vent metagenome]|uniref:Uncharacterized protein n=1 Tax=hydrothermal vent metagenome TaxID=652676 RepID=A0A1W1D2Z6_9ZZZZ
MKYLFLIIFSTISLYSAQILNYNIYNRTDRVDMMITFDMPYDGKIIQSVQDSKIIIKLEDAEIESSKIKKLSSDLVTYLSITPMEHYTQIVAFVPHKVDFIASKTIDGYGLRLRFKQKSSPLTHKNPAEEKLNNLNKIEQNINSLPTKKESATLSTSYYIVVSILIVGIVILFVLKNKINSQTSKKNSWLSSNNTSAKKSVNDFSKNDISIRFQKDINPSNSIIMIDFAEQSYLIFMGTNNTILLDKFQDNKPTNKQDFESILQKKQAQIDEVLKVEHNEEEVLQSYKERAASILS